METQILAFGDSITYGAWDEKGGWVSRLREFIDAKSKMGSKFYCEVYNLGVSGDTTDGLLKRLEAETKNRAGDGKQIFIFDIGSNDSAFVHKTKTNLVPPERFKQNIEKIIKLSKKFSPKLIFLGLIPADEPKVDPIPWRPDLSYRNEYVSQYNSIVKEVCEKSEVPFISQFDVWSKIDFRKLLNKDGIHPNGKGHQKIFEKVRDFLKESKILEI